jgi:putative hydrolase of HD superfamily
MHEFLTFFSTAEKLKTTLRHSWTNDPKRQESVAEHSWMICLVAMTFKDRLTIKVDLNKVLKMLVLHDLAEAVTGDIPLGMQTGSFSREAKIIAEREAMHKILAPLDEATRSEFLTLWEEECERKTPEAKFAKAIDSIEACIQHWISDIRTWDDQDFAVGIYHKDEIFEHDPFLKELKTFLDTETMKKIIAADMEHRVDPAKRERYRLSQATNTTS